MYQQKYSFLKKIHDVTNRKYYLRTNSDEVDVEALDVCFELRELIQHFLSFAKWVSIGPVIEEALQLLSVETVFKRNPFQRRGERTASL